MLKPSRHVSQNVEFYYNFPNQLYLSMALEKKFWHACLRKYALLKISSNFDSEYIFFLYITEYHKNNFFLFQGVFLQAYLQ